jgi:beta-phosphoglucomutase-like phosphatase (HAD superfamily)
MNFDAFLFDKDGTIFDSEAVYCQAWMASAKAFDVKFTRDMYKRFVGKRSDECYQQAQLLFGSNFPMAKFIAYQTKIIEQKKASGLNFKSGFPSFFQTLLFQQLPIALVTSSDRKATLSSFAPYPVYLDKFQVMVTGDQVINAKPDPQCYLMACQQLGIAPKRALVFEDSTAGITAAIAAGCQVAAIPDLLPISETLLAKCTYVFNNFKEALVLLK